ncbi:hairy-related 3 [Antennarius striatus]|uniref:hairy-related 3 n=1 Tax=Antennarius striatus TaxID=241820 RepID=UPI0035B1DE7F
MVAKVDIAEHSKPCTGNKVSKPVMEKKRRARINKCLDQLKSLLESYYSTSIRKRKLEKADILELTVNHLRNLQKLHSCTAAASEIQDYHNGFCRCLANVNQYLMMAENLHGSDRWMLSQLSAKLCLSRGRKGVFSTMDSSVGEAKTRDEARILSTSPAGPEEKERSRSRDVEASSTSPSLPSTNTKQLTGNEPAGLFASPEKTREGRSSHKRHSSSHRGVATSAPQDVWRPW